MHQLTLELKSTNETTRNELRALKSKYKFLEIDHQNLKEIHQVLWLKIKRDTFFIEAKDEIDVPSDVVSISFYPARSSAQISLRIPTGLPILQVCY